MKHDRKNIYVVGQNELDLKLMKGLRNADQFRFHTLITHAKMKGRDEFPVKKFLSEAIDRLNRAPDRADAIVGFWDFPISTILPILRKRLNLPGPTLEAVIKCEHKYWSRVLQSEIIPDIIPPFHVIDPFEAGIESRQIMPFPFWLKPIKSASSHLGFYIRNKKDFVNALGIIREKIGRFAGPMNYILTFADLPAFISPYNGYYCIAEGIISKGHQCTLEGYVLNNEVYIYGVVDSIREGRHQSCFSRYQYPSTIPLRVRNRMAEQISTLLLYLGFNNSPFNAEFFWNRNKDTIHLLEVNPRISRSHSPLFKLVDGESNHTVMLDVALMRKPDFPDRKGTFKVAAKFMLREYQNGLVLQTPNPKDIQRLKSRFPDAEVQIHIRKGMHLSDLYDQDSYSYEIAALFLGANSQKELLAKYRESISILPFNIIQIEATS